MVPSTPTEPHQHSAADRAWIERLEVPLSLRADGPLAGLRFAVKDNIDVAGLPTTAACPAFAYRPTQHAEVVRRLLESGATLVGKTNLDQFACGLNGTRSPYGAVPNAFDATLVSGGSSSGSSYVVATGQVDFALGTDTAGSGRVPAGLQNIVGLKPSRGAISTHGVVPAAPSIDCVSIFATTVALAARVLDVCVGPDARDPFSRVPAWHLQRLPNAFRFGVLPGDHPVGDEHNRAAYLAAIDRLKTLGGTPVVIDFEPFAHAAALLYESALVAERYAALRHFFDAHEVEVIEPVRSILARGRQYSAADHCDALRQLKVFEQQARAAWAAMDVLVLPTASAHYSIEQMLADPVALNRNLGTFTNFVNLLDYAALAVPAAQRPDGLPFGVTLIGPRGSDWQLAELGQRFHHGTGLPQGACGKPLPAPATIPRLRPDAWVRVAVVGAHLTGMPLNSQLTDRGGRLVGVAKTAPHYRLFALPSAIPPKPGLLRVADRQGGTIVLEIWEMPVEHYGSFVALIAPPLGIGTLTLSDGTTVQGFLCEAQALQGAQDITHLGGWRSFIEAQTTNVS